MDQFDQMTIPTMHSARALGMFLLLLVVLWQAALEPRINYFRNRGDRFSQDLLQAKFLFVVGAIFLMIGELIVWYRMSLFVGILFLAFGIWRLQMAIFSERERQKSQRQSSD